MYMDVLVQPCGGALYLDLDTVRTRSVGYLSEKSGTARPPLFTAGAEHVLEEMCSARKVNRS